MEEGNETNSKIECDKPNDNENSHEEIKDSPPIDDDKEV